jgi:hypothetical protein
MLACMITPGAREPGGAAVVKRPARPRGGVWCHSTLTDNRPPSLIGLRDRALIAVMVFSFARITAALGMNVEDYYTEGRRAWVSVR